MDIGVRCLWLCRVRLPGCVWFIRFGHLHLPGKIKKAYSLQLIIFVSMEVVITTKLLILNLFMPKMEYLFRNRAKTLQPTLELSVKKHLVSLLLQVHTYQSPQSQILHCHCLIPLVWVARSLTLKCKWNTDTHYMQQVKLI